MPKVNLEELEKQEAAKLKASKSVEVQEVLIDGKKYYKDPVTGNAFSTWDEAFSSLQDARRVDGLKKQGLDEYGRSAEQIAMAERKAQLLKKKALILEDAKKIDQEIARLSVEDFKPKKGK